MNISSILPCRTFGMAGQTAPSPSARPFARFLAVAAMVGALGMSVARAEQPVVSENTAGFVYTANEHGNSLSMIDLASGRVETVPVSISPHNVQMTADGTRLLAVGVPATHMGAGHASKREGQLLVFDPDKLALGPIASIAVGDHPGHVVADREARRAFVTLASANAVAVVDLAASKVTGTIATGRYPHGLRISPDGREIYVANVKDGSVSVIDTATLAETARIPVGRAPVQVGFTPDGSRVYVSLRDENRVGVIDTRTRKVLGRIGVGHSPIQVHATPDGRFVYVANQGTEAKPADTVSVIDVAAGKVIDTIRTGAGAHGVAVSEDGRNVFVSNIVDGTVTMIDVKNRLDSKVFAVGKGPNGITVRAAADRRASTAPVRLGVQIQ
jgi:YVTN family beta-propeller protein